MIAVLSLGSNIGDKEYYLNEAIHLLEEKVGTVLKQSSIIETSPYGYLDQDNFLNMALTIDTTLTPYELLDEIHNIEHTLKRVRDIRWGPRTCDIDIIFYEDMMIDNDDLHIPHIDFHNRFFVLEPLDEIIPGFIDPRTHKTIHTLLLELRDKQ